MRCAPFSFVFAWLTLRHKTEIMLHALFVWLKSMGDLLVIKGWNASLVRVLSALFIIAVLVAAALGIYWFVRLVFHKILMGIKRKRHKKWPEIFIERKLLHYFCYFLLAVLYRKMVPYIFEELPGWIPFMGKLFSLVVLVFAMRVTTGFLWVFYDLYRVKMREQPIAMKGLIQFVCIGVYFCSAIIAISILIDRSPLVFIGGLSAASAVLMLVFKDSITGLVAGVQLARNDMVRIGDWITMPGQGVDGTVIDISLTTVKVKNFDLTVIMVPAYLLITQSVQNWRGLNVSGGRRIMRSVYIDMTRIQICTPAMLQQFALIPALKEFMSRYADDTAALPLTNVEVYMKYMEDYLRRHPDIQQGSDFYLLVRQLPAEDIGLPVQIYCYANTPVWKDYEAIATQIMAHALAVLPAFGLGIYERSAQPDLRELDTARITR